MGQIVGRIHTDIYQCITEDIITEEVILTDNQLQHIKERHPSDYEIVLKYCKIALENPDYIIEDRHKNTGLVIKRLDEGKDSIQIVLHICTSQDDVEYKNSIISCWRVSEKRLLNYLRNKKVLYKRE